MSDILKQFIAGAIGGFITFLTSLLAAVQEMSVEASAISDISGMTWLVTGIGGVVAAFTSWRTLLSAPPK